jgi:hypothetical protein
LLQSSISSQGLQKVLFANKIHVGIIHQMLP